MLGDEPGGQPVVGHVGDDRGEGRPELVLQRHQLALVSGDADDVHAVCRETGGDGPAEAAAGSGDDGGSAGKSWRWASVAPALG